MERIDSAIANVGDQMSLNYQLVIANKNFSHYREWADKKLTDANRVINSQRHEIEILERS